MTDSMLGQPTATEPAAPERSSPVASPAGWTATLPGDLSELAQKKGWASADDALRSYKNLEEYMGADKAGRGVLLPKGPDDADGYNALYSALGRPESATDYGLNSLYDGVDIDTDMLNNFSEVMHKNGLSSTQATALATAYRDMEIKAAESAQEKLRQEYAVAAKEVPAATQELARRAMRHLGLPEEQHQAVARSLEMSLGPKQALEYMAKFGELLGEDNPPANSETEYQSGFKMTPESASKRMDSLMHDDSFVKRYMGGDPSAAAEMDRLARLATA